MRLCFFLCDRAKALQFLDFIVLAFAVASPASITINCNLNVFCNAISMELILPSAPGLEVAALSQSVNLITLITEINSKEKVAHDPSQSNRGQENSLLGFYLGIRRQTLFPVEVPGSMWVGAARPHSGNFENLALMEEAGARTRDKRRPSHRDWALDKVYLITCNIQCCEPPHFHFYLRNLESIFCHMQPKASWHTCEIRVFS